MGLTVCKFGGTSLANPEMVGKVIDIVRSNPDRKAVVVSAPGKDAAFPYKITDLLFNLFYRRQYDLYGEKWDPDQKNRQNMPDAGVEYRPQYFTEKELVEKIVDRYRAIADSLNCGSMIGPIQEELIGTLESITTDSSHDLMASRGEAFNARIIAKALDAELLEPTSLIYYDGKSAWNPTTKAWMKKAASDRRVVMPGYYCNGSEDGSVIVKVLPRGGSDLTGALYAAGRQALLYENWTDISGIQPMSPDAIDKSFTLKPIDKLSYLEARELASSGFGILQEDTIGPAMDAGIPIRVRNTFSPDDLGTLVSYENDSKPDVTGISGTTSITNIEVQKAGIQTAVGFVSRLYAIIEKMGLSIEHHYDGQNLVGFGFQAQAIKGLEEKLEAAIQEEVSPDKVIWKPNLAYVTLVKQDRKIGVLSRMFTSLENAGVEILPVSGAESKLSITIGIPQDSYRRAMKALATEFFAR
jgi:aspartate kinase